MKIKQWLTATAVTTSSLILLSSITFAADPMKSDMVLKLNGKDASFTAQTFLVESNLYGPADEVARQLGAEVTWNAAAKTLTLRKSGSTIEFTANMKTVKVNGVELALTAPLQVIGEKAYVPVRFIYEILGYAIAYDSKTRAVSVSSDTLPSMRVLGISEGQYLTSSELKIAVWVENVTLTDFKINKAAKSGEGHLLVWLDTELDPKLAITSYKGEPIEFNHIKPGEHTLTVQLVGNDSLPLQPEVKQTIKFNTAQISILADLDPQQATGMRTEGVIADNKGHVFTVDSDSKKLFRIKADSGKVDVLTELPRAATGLGLDASGNLYMASGGQEGVILRVLAKDLEGEMFDTSKVETYVSGVAGANGLAFDKKGNLYVTGGANGNIYMVTPDGKLNTFKSGLQPERTEQLIVVNGIAFGQDGKLYVSNTSSGEINRFTVNADGSLGSSELVAKSPLLYGADGINFGPDNALYVCANERNSIVKVTIDGKVTEVAHNDNKGPLEFPASPYFIGSTLYISNFDQPRGDNKPNEPGIGASIVQIQLGPVNK
ncbi:SMP-30/Gluconolaconase/LRE-like region-containing protein [Paenibacillus sp. 1_12]|uniref:stalk domain-containing protein n=1 Tax=Paenibacillus sp. 1_12 TaxID=1566278 RepID=UPI0008EC8C9F|nr:stalk domain-containing protein [Paenibacillus sp. 1_12]SFL12982.1 SMP-30/Gluconolaconase/LRE-like region-containing protein [Paenibacillus sp. 1_12]